MKSRFVIYIPTDTDEATSVSFAKVCGVPLWLRPILAMEAAGITAFTIVSPANHRRQILKNIQKVIKNRRIHISLIFTKSGSKLEADEARELVGHVDEQVYFFNANYILPGLAGYIKDNLLSTVIKAGEVGIFKPMTKRLALVALNRKDVETFIERVETKPATIEDLLEKEIEGLSKRYHPFGDEGIIVEKFAETYLAEHMLAEHIRVNTGTWVAREINKRISLPFSLILARMRIGPNIITVVNIFIGLCAGIGAAGRTYTGVLLGAILFQTASIIDGCDGEVAKLTFRTSKFGQYIDSLSDNLSLVAFLTGMMIHQYRVTGSTHAFMVGGALLVGVALFIAIMAEYLKHNTNSASFVTYDKEVIQKLNPDNTPRIVLLLIKYFRFFFKKDSFSLIFLITAIFGVLHLWFYVIAFGVWVGVAVLFYLRERDLKAKKAVAKSKEA